MAPEYIHDNVCLTFGNFSHLSNLNFFMFPCFDIPIKFCVPGLWSSFSLMETKCERGPNSISDNKL